MRAAITNFDMDEATMALIQTSKGTTTSTLFSRLGVRASDCHCPSCNSIVYCRRHDLCSVCGETLPEACRFTKGEARRVESLFETERSRHRAWLRKASFT